MAYEYGASKAQKLRDELANIEAARLAAELRIQRAELARVEREAMEAEKRAQRATCLDYERAVAFSQSLGAPKHGGHMGLRQAAAEIEAHNKRKRVGV